jgi:hypothetical protein
MNVRYDENGNAKGKPEFIPPTPTRLAWELNEENCLAAIEDAHLEAQKLLNVSPSVFVGSNFKFKTFFSPKISRMLNSEFWFMTRTEKD